MLTLLAEHMVLVDERHHKGQGNIAQTMTLGRTKDV